MAIIDFLSPVKGLFTDQSTIPVFVVGSCDPFHTVASKSEETLKRIKIDYESQQTITKLFKIFLGTDKNAAVDPSLKIQPAGIMLKIRIIAMLCRSLLAANSFPFNVQLIFDAFYGSESNMKLKQNCMPFVQWMFRMAQQSQLKTVGPIILNGLLKLLDELLQTPQETQEYLIVKRFCFESVGLLGKRVPEIIRGQFDAILPKYFSLLSLEKETSVKMAIQDTLVALCGCFSNPSSADPWNQKILPLLEEHLSGASSNARFCSIFYLNRVFPFEYLPARYLGLLCLTDKDHDVKQEAQKGKKPYVMKDNEIYPLPEGKDDVYPSANDAIPYFADKVCQDYGETAVQRHPVILTEFIKFLRNCIETAVKAVSEDPKNYSSSYIKVLSFRKSSESQPLAAIYFSILSLCLKEFADSTLRSDVHFE
jgi:hypothetical protein